MGFYSVSQNNDWEHLYRSACLSEGNWLRGDECIFYPCKSYKRDLGSDYHATLGDPITINVTLEDYSERELEKMNWIVEDDNLPYKAHISNIIWPEFIKFRRKCIDKGMSFKEALANCFDSHHILKNDQPWFIRVSKYSILEFPYRMEEAGSQKFRITKVTGDQTNPFIWLCTVVPHRDQYDLQPNTPDIADTNTSYNPEHEVEGYSYLKHENREENPEDKEPPNPDDKLSTLPSKPKVPGNPEDPMPLPNDKDVKPIPPKKDEGSSLPNKPDLSGPLKPNDLNKPDKFEPLPNDKDVKPLPPDEDSEEFKPLPDDSDSEAKPSPPDNPDLDEFKPLPPEGESKEPLSPDDLDTFKPDPNPDFVEPEKPSEESDLIEPEIPEGIDSDEVKSLMPNDSKDETESLTPDNSKDEKTELEIPDTSPIEENESNDSEKGESRLPNVNGGDESKLPGVSVNDTPSSGVTPEQSEESGIPKPDYLSDKDLPRDTEEKGFERTPSVPTPEDDEFNPYKKLYG